MIIGHDMIFELAELQPWTSYDLRFASSNKVGISPWSEYLQITLPRPKVPDEPVLYVYEMPMNSSIETFIVDNRTAIVTWDTPEHNGDVIDYYELTQVKVNSKHYGVLNQSKHGDLASMRNQTISVTRIPSDQQRILTLKNLPQDSFIKVILRAHNIAGYSEPAIVLLSTFDGNCPAVTFSSLIQQTFRQRLL